MKKKLLAILFALGIVGIFLSSSNFSMGAVFPQTVGVFETSLASPISTSATSMTLTANAVRGGTTLSGYTCFTVDQGSAQAEFICGTVSGTSVTALVRGIDPATGTSTVTALQFAHRRGASVKITDFPAIVIMRHQLNGSDSIYNLIKYDTNVLIGVGSPTSTIATKYYVDNTASAGAATADETTKGLVEPATAIEQASSTSIGATGASLVKQAKYSSSSPTTGCDGTSTKGALCSVVAQNDGKITPNYIATSSSYAYNWGASTTFTNGVSVTATTTFLATTTHAKPEIGFTHFGGTGVDGALNVSSGVTTIDLGGSGYVEKNYASISITGTGMVNFSNASPNGSVIVLKSQGACNLTSSAAPMLTATGTGSVAGYSRSLGVGGSGSGITASTTLGAIYGYSGGSGSSLASTGVTAASVPSLAPNGYLVTDGRILKYSYAMPGAGGGSGAGQSDGSGSPVTGAGGRGAGALIMECAGTWNFTTANGISVQGIAGTNGTYGGTRGEAIGGAGGGAGEFIALYNYLIANTGSVTVTGGSSGTTVCTVGGGINGSSGAAGGNSVLGIGGTGSAGGVNSCGNSGAGASGTSTIMLNTQFN